MEDITAGDAEAALQVERRQYLPVLHNRADVGRILLDQRDHAVAERLAQFVPRAFAQRVRRVLQEDAHDVLARRRERRIVHGGDGEFEQRPLRRAAILGVVPGALHVLDARANVHRRAVVRAGREGAAGKHPGISRELRQSVEREVDLAACTFDAVVVNRGHEIRIEVAFVEQLQKRQLRIEVRNHRAGFDLLAAPEGHAARASAAHQHLAYGGVHANRYAALSRRSRDGL